MSRAAMITIAILAVLAASLAAVSTAESDAAGPYGDDGLGAREIIFDANGGSGGYTQRALAGATLYFPTEKGSSDTTYYEQIARAGYALAGWHAEGDPAHVYAPGSQVPGAPASKYIAEWEEITYDGNKSNPHYLAAAGTQAVYRSSESNGTLTNGYGNESLNGHDSVYWAFLDAFGAASGPNSTDGSIDIYVTDPSGTEYPKITITLYDGGSNNLTGNGYDLGDCTIRYIWGSGEVEITGTLSEVGLWKLRFVGGHSGVEGILFLTAYDQDTDPSNKCTVTWGGSTVGAGPLGTAVRLPDAANTPGPNHVDNHSGWRITDDGAESTYALGSAYTLQKRSTVLAAATYTTDILQHVGVIAFNAMGGTTTAALAVPVMKDGGYGALMAASGVTKEGFTLLGWNSTGNAGDLIYPAEYLYDASGSYTELKAVWAAGTLSTCAVSFYDKEDAATVLHLVPENTYSYATPVHGYDAAGFDLVGWTPAKGSAAGKVLPGAGITVSAAASWYGLYENHTYTHTIAYVSNGGLGGTFEVPYRASGSQQFAVWTEDEAAEAGLVRTGYSLAGWAADDGGGISYELGGLFTITDAMDGSTTSLYAVWRENAQPPVGTHTYTITFVAREGQNVPAAVTYASAYGTCNLRIPSAEPTRDGYLFAGWTANETADTADPGYAPGRTVTLTSGNPVLTLYAVWAHNSAGGDGSQVLVTFKNISGMTVKEERINAGDRLDSPSINVPNGYAHAGWKTAAGREWNFAADAFTVDTVLIPISISIFSVDVDGTSLRVSLDRNANISSATITYSDDQANPISYSPGDVIAPHEAPADYSGWVKVTADTDRGELTARWDYRTGAEDPQDSEGGISAVQIGIAIAVVIALLAVARWYL